MQLNAGIHALILASYQKTVKALLTVPKLRQSISQLTFALKALFSQDADEGQELGDLFQVEHGGVVELDDGHRLLVVGTAAAVLPQTVAGNNSA